MKPVMRSRFILIVLCVTMVAEAQAGFFDFFHRQPKPLTLQEFRQQQAAQRAKQNKPVVPKKYLFQQ